MKKTYETFREIGDYEIDNLTDKVPSCFNSNVRIKKYRITIEEIETTKEILAERLQKLWDECDNWHHWESLKHTARNIGYELKNNPGTSRKN